MKILSLDLNDSTTETVKKAAEILTSGGIIVYPTDTAYGIAVDATNEEAIEKLYNLKGRDNTKPTHVVVKDWDMVKRYTHTTPVAKKLFETFFPGPLTMILTKKGASLPSSLTGGLPTLGVRMPDTTFTQALSLTLPFPYTTPSANRSGEKTPYSICEVQSVLDISKVDLVIDAGPLSPTPPSTVVDITQKEMKILREGPISESVILEALASLTN